LSEHPATVASVYLPFRRRAWTRPFEYLLAPGWFSGTWFILLLGGILLAGALLFPNVWEAAGLGSDEKAVGLVLGVIASALLPLAVMLIPRQGNPQPIVSYCLITIFMGTVSSTVIPFVDHGDIPALAWLGMILPPVATYAMLNDSLAMEEVMFVAGITVVVAILSLAIVHWKWGKIRRAMEQARRQDFVA
jgi:hypothetical protein